LLVELFKSVNDAARKSDQLAPLAEVELDVVHCSPNSSMVFNFKRIILIQANSKLLYQYFRISHLLRELIGLILLLAYHLT